MLNITTEWNETKKIYAEYIHYTHPYTYDEWMNLPEDEKAAALYVQFYNEITLAWYKSKSFYATEQEGVETVAQYLMKNVPIIEKNPKRFNARYIYRVAYNCLFCIAHDRISDRQRWELEVSNVCRTADGELDLFDTYIDDAKYEVDSDPYADEREDLWATIFEKFGEEGIQFCGYLLDGGRMPKGFSAKKKKETIEKLQEALEEFREVFYL